mmetsp:Transcript_31789/g.49203  ORF Transcript_31789/g.49203 Transcript_31789/m.49203 type:complete len:125 (-) Transcript_31789:182-556(-)
MSLNMLQISNKFDGRDQIDTGRNYYKESQITTIRQSIGVNVREEPKDTTRKRNTSEILDLYYYDQGNFGRASFSIQETDCIATEAEKKIELTFMERTLYERAAEVQAKRRLAQILKQYRGGGIL